MDRIDLRILRLLQQRTKLSDRIGQLKRRHGAVIYVPERERELLAHARRVSKGKLPARALDAIYREILSSSRAAQGQAPIGLLRSSAATVLPAGRWCFGACDEFLPFTSWTGVAAGLEKDSLALALLTGGDLKNILQATPARRRFLNRFEVIGDFLPVTDHQSGLIERIFIVTPRAKGTDGNASRLLILIECKSTVNAVKSLANSMPNRPLQAEHLALGSRSARGGRGLLLARLTLGQAMEGVETTTRLLAAGKSAGLGLHILGVYPGSEDYDG